MTRVGKYMVYNPKAKKPTMYFDTQVEAINEANRLNDKENTDILVLKVIANMENANFKILRSQFELQKRKWKIIED